MSHRSCNHFLVLRRHMEPVQNPCLHFSTCNKFVANQYQYWKTILILVPLMRKNEVKLHLYSYVFKLVAMSIRDWLLALKHIKTPKILSWKISRSGICMEFFKLNTWCKYSIIYVGLIEKVKHYSYLVTRKWTKR